MGLPTKIINIRLSPEQTERFERLKSEFAGLPQATVLRLLVSSVLEMQMSAQVELLTKQIRKPGVDPDLKPERNRLNSKGERHTT